MRKKARHADVLVEPENVRTVTCHDVALEIAGRRSIVEHRPELVAELISVRRLPSAPGVEAVGNNLMVSAG